MRKGFYFVLCLLVFKCSGQPVSVEVMPGNGNYWYQHSISRQLEKSRLGFFNASSTCFFYKSEDVEIMSQSYLTFRLNKTFKLSLGTFYATAPRLKPSVNLHFRRSGKNWTLLLVPRIDVYRNGSYDLFFSLEHNPQIRGNTALYVRLQAMSNYTGKRHNRSYQLLRVGLDYEKMQFGLGINFDSLGEVMRYYCNYGFFLKRDFF
jgi:hypothetical protein